MDRLSIIKDGNLIYINGFPPRKHPNDSLKVCKKILEATLGEINKQLKK